MIVNGKTLIGLEPIKDMLTTKRNFNGVSYGLSEAGYDIRIKQDVSFEYDSFKQMAVYTGNFTKLNNDLGQMGRFTIASAIEEFQMPDNLVGEVKDKSSWARRGLSVFNTVVEPGWNGFLTLELVYHGEEELFIPAGSGIAQVIFYRTSDRVKYNGKYQNQADKPVSAILE